MSPRFIHHTSSETASMNAWSSNAWGWWQSRAIGDALPNGRQANARPAPKSELGADPAHVAARRSPTFMRECLGFDAEAMTSKKGYM
jgi:hypothetical protein